MLHKSKFALLSLVFLFIAVGASRADTLTFSGDTSPISTPTFNRPEVNGSALASVGTNVPYNVRGFRVTVAGAYSFVSTAQDTRDLNPFLILYSGAFNPANSLTNFVVANDDLPGGIVVNDINSQAGFTRTLSVNTNYFLVTTGFTIFDAGAFTNQITGPGAFVTVPTSAVPEPATLLLLGTGLAGVAAARRRRKAAHEKG